jgi:MarR family transcriptional regulator, transcriptional regulator for hemolysin
MPNPDQMFGLVLHDVARLLRRRYEQRLRATGIGLGLTRSQCAVLVNLARHQGINQTCLAQVLDIEPISLVRLLDRLQEAGLVDRKPDPKDRRAYIPELTVKAKPILDQIYGLAQSVYDEAQAGLSKAETTRFLGELQTIKANLLATTAEAAAAITPRSKSRA